MHLSTYVRIYLHSYVCVCVCTYIYDYLDASNFIMILSYQPHRTFAVRFAVSADLDAVQQLVNSTSHADTILHDVESYLAAKRDKILEVFYVFVHLH